MRSTTDWKWRGFTTPGLTTVRPPTKVKSHTKESGEAHGLEYRCPHENPYGSFQTHLSTRLSLQLTSLFNWRYRSGGTGVDSGPPRETSSLPGKSTGRNFVPPTRKYEDVVDQFPTPKETPLVHTTWSVHREKSVSLKGFSLRRLSTVGRRGSSTPSSPLSAKSGFTFGPNKCRSR